MPYCKAVVLEGLRWHPLAHFLLPPTMTQESELDGYVMPKKVAINFSVGRWVGIHECGKTR